MIFKRIWENIRVSMTRNVADCETSILFGDCHNDCPILCVERYRSILDHCMWQKIRRYAFAVWWFLLLAIQRDFNQLGQLHPMSRVWDVLATRNISGV